MTTDEKIDLLTKIVSQHHDDIAELATTARSHERQFLSVLDSLRSLERTAVAHQAEIEKLHDEIRDLTRQWQAYINTLPRA